MPNDPWLNSPEWRKFRAAYLLANPTCIVPGCNAFATQVDHIVARADHGALFDPNNCQPMCARCHSRKTAMRDRPSYRKSGKRLMAMGCDANGNPLSPDHHWNK